ncbi:hypothetical protein LLY42_26715 [Pseudomonas frederiksbergensis]|nr:hypothetical protein LLY42_26715 [Pseudomonas frederiksbergensis]
MPTTSNHPLLKFLAGLPQFHTKLLEGAVLDMRTGTFVFKHDGGMSPNTGIHSTFDGPAKTQVFTLSSMEKNTDTSKLKKQLSWERMKQLYISNYKKP